MKRPIRVIYYSSHFARQYARLPLAMKRLAEKKEALLRTDAFDARLGTHKLKGKLEGRWAFQVAPDLRIVFRFLNGDKVLFLAVGPHETVY